MERSLALILNGREDNRMPLHGTIFLTLETMEAKDLDVFVSKNFESYDEVRRRYASQIQAFLEQNRTFVERVERQTGRKFNGSIIITELDDNLILERKKVLYRKHLIMFKEITKNRKFMLALEARDYLNECKAKTDKKHYRRLFSEFFSAQLRFHCCSEDKFRRISGQWRNAIKESKYYYDYVRVALKEYKERYKELGLESLDVIYARYLSNAEAKKQTTRMAEIESDIEDLSSVHPQDRLSTDLISHLSDYEEPKRYRTYADEEGYPGDLDDGSKDIIPEDEIHDFDRGRAKVLSYEQLTFFDQKS